MPIYLGSQLIEHVFDGGVLIPEVYSGPDLVHQEPLTQILTLTSGTDVNLATWLGAQGADAGKPIIINFASDQTIGGTVEGAPALDFGDLSAYAHITFNMNGQVRGIAGGDAISVHQNIDVDNSGEIAGGIQDGLDTTGDSTITLVISSTGKVLAGGGDGGKGGKGGNGDDVPSWTAYQFNDTPGNLYYYDRHINPSYWANVNIGTTAADDAHYILAPTYVYHQGTFQDDGTTRLIYSIRRGVHRYGTGGVGGAAGVGQGYGQGRTNGAAGTAGTYRSGGGGKGGNGGTWGVAGSAGANGSGGLYYSVYASSNVRAGTAGAAGTPAGLAFTSTATVNILTGY